MKKVMKKALFILRAQPFHLGHLHAIKDTSEKFDKVIIGIGSSQEKNTWENPFSLKERKLMIKSCLKKLKNYKKFKLISIPDFPDDKEWVNYCLKKVEFDVVISGSKWVKECFKGVKKVLEPNFFKPRKYKASRIRKLMALGKKWEDLVPPEVVKIIKRIDGEKRVKRIYQHLSLSR